MQMIIALLRMLGFVIGPIWLENVPDLSKDLSLESENPLENQRLKWKTQNA